MFGGQTTYHDMNWGRAYRSTPGRFFDFTFLDFELTEKK